MKLLNELQNILNLNYTQQAVLANVKFSATPKQAYASTIGNDKLVYARDSLVQMGFISTNNGQITLTPRGEIALEQYNLMDETDQPTEYTRELLKQFNITDVNQPSL